MKKGSMDIRDKYVLSAKETGEYLGIGENTIRSLCVLGKIKHFKVGRNYRITKKDAEEFAQRLADDKGMLDVDELIKKGREEMNARKYIEDQWAIQ